MWVWPPRTFTSCHLFPSWPLGEPPVHSFPVPGVHVTEDVRIYNTLLFLHVSSWMPGTLARLLGIDHKTHLTFYFTILKNKKQKYNTISSRRWSWWCIVACRGSKNTHEDNPDYSSPPVQHWISDTSPPPHPDPEPLVHVQGWETRAADFLR